MSADDTPTPGSDVALAQGCTCPVLDNAHGLGGFWHGERVYWISEDCPLHGQHEPEDTHEPGR